MPAKLKRICLSAPTSAHRSRDGDRRQGAGTLTSDSFVHLLGALLHALVRLIERATDRVRRLHGELVYNLFVRHSTRHDLDDALRVRVKVVKELGLELGPTGQLDLIGLWGR